VASCYWRNYNKIISKILLALEMACDTLRDSLVSTPREKTRIKLDTHVAIFCDLELVDSIRYICDPNAVYIVTGGFGGIGIKSVGILLTTSLVGILVELFLTRIYMLINLGARHIVVISRSGKPSAGKPLQSLEKWQAAGIDIDTQATDMTDFKRLQVLVALFFIVTWGK
jgi:hypothetical protein